MTMEGKETENNKKWQYKSKLHGYTEVCGQYA